MPYRTQKPEASDLVFYNCGSSLYAEADFISSLLASESNGKKSAILVKYNKSADIIASKLTKNSIGFFKISGFDLFERTYMRDLKAYFSAIVSPFDFMAWSRLFKLFGCFRTQKAAMAFTQSIYNLGILPIDFLDPYVDFNFPLKTLVDIFYKERVVVFDTETTGLNIYTDDIIQIAAVEYLAGKKGREFEVYIKTSKSLAGSEKIHHISQGILDAKGVEPRVGLQSFCDFVGGSVLVAHNLQFDIAVLKANLSRFEVDFQTESKIIFDTLELSRRLFLKRSSYKLEDLLDDFGIQGVNSHNALDDVHATGNLLMFIVDKVVQSNLLININDVIQSKNIITFRNNFLPLWLRLCSDVQRESTIRDETLHFFDYCVSNNCFDCPDETYAVFTEDFYSEIDKFLVFTDVKYKKQPFLELIDAVKNNLSQLKETDLLLGNESIVISTIHKAKGLEFDRVLIPECISGIYPSYQFLHHSAADCDLEEEARVLYVGLTRARQQLVILCHEEKQRGYSEFIEPVVGQFSTCDDFISESGCNNFTYFHKQEAKSDWLLRYRNVLDVANGVVDFDFPLLERAINDEDWSVRIAAIDAFTRLDVKAASDLICKRLDDDNSKVRCTAIRSLVKLGYKELLQFVLIFVGKQYPQAVRVESIRAIATIGDCSSLVNFQELLADELEEIRFESILVLSNFTGARVVELLLLALYDQSPHVRLKSAQILYKLGFTKWEAVIRGDSYDWYRMGEQEELDIDHVISLLETYQKIDAVRCLGNSNNDHATDKLLALAEETYLDSETLEALIEAFGNLRCEKAIKFLKRKIDSGYTFLKLRIAAAFRKIGGEYSIPPLLYMLSDLSPDVRLYSAKALESLEVADWRAFVKGFPDDFGRLGKTHDSAMVPLLIHRYRDRALRNDNGPIRKLIALSLFDLGRLEWKDIFLGDDDDWVRLCTQVPAGSNGLLHLLLKDQNPVIRVKASRGLLSLGEAQWIDLVKGDKLDWKRMAVYLKGRK